MKLGSFPKQPSERLSCSVTYTDALDSGDSISIVSSCIAEPAGLTVTSVLVSDDRVRLWVSDGLDGTSYKITVTTATHGGEIFEDELTCKVKSV